MRRGERGLSVSRSLTSSHSENGTQDYWPHCIRQLCCTQLYIKEKKKCHRTWIGNCATPIDIHVHIIIIVTRNACARSVGQSVVDVIMYCGFRESCKNFNARARKFMFKLNGKFHAWALKDSLKPQQ
jgi:hypothetical protein